MLLKAPLIEIDKENPFKNDLLAREESAKTLTELIKSISEPFVICIDAPWGQGKTTFLKMWRQHLSNNNIQSLYFNAWESDFSDDALVSLIGEIEAGIKEIKLPESNKTKARKHIEKAKKFGTSLVKQALPIAAKLATAGALDLNKLTENALSSLSESIVREQIQKYESAKNTVESFKKELQAFVQELASGNEEEKSPLVFIIDELDRCRPTYAIEVLEKAKHFFNVQNIVFVLAIDKEQIGHSIKSVYGSGMDVQGYLRRFIDIDYSLTPPKKGVFAKALLNRFGINEYFNKKTGSETRYEGEQISGVFRDLFSILGLSLREQEHCLSQLSIAIRTTPEGYKLYSLLLGTLIVLKIKNSDLYKKFITKRTDYRAILKYIDSSEGGKDFIDSNDGAALEAFLVLCTEGWHNAEKVIKPYD